MSTVTAIRMDVDGTLDIHQLDQDSTGSLLQALYAALGAELIETFQLPGRVDVIFDEEGKATGAAPNPRATRASYQLGGEFFPGDYIAGPALFLGYNDEGEHVSLTHEQMTRIMAASLR